MTLVHTSVWSVDADLYVYVFSNLKLHKRQVLLEKPDLR